MIDGRQVIAIIFAGGAGQRLRESCADNFVQNLPKQFLDVNGCPILIHTLNIFQLNDKVDKIYIATHKDYFEYTNEGYRAVVTLSERDYGRVKEYDTL